MTMIDTELEDVDLETDDRDVHIRCMACKHEPITSVCGVVMEPEEELTGEVEINCPRCTELWPMHIELLHPFHRSRQRRRL